MAKTNTKRMDGGQYVCAQCDQRFSSIAELRDHEKLCRNSSAPLGTKGADGLPAASG